MTPNSCKSIFFSCLWSLLPGQHKKLWCPQSATAERVKVSQTTASISSLQKCPVPRVGSVYENLLRSFNVCNLISCRKASVGGVSAEPDRTRAISFSRLLVHVQSSSTELIATGLFPPHTPSHSPFAVKIREVSDNLAARASGDGMIPQPWASPVLSLHIWSTSCQILKKGCSNDLAPALLISYMALGKSPNICQPPPSVKWRGNHQKASLTLLPPPVLNRGPWGLKVEFFPV